MRKIRDVLRLKLEARRSHERIAASLVILLLSAAGENTMCNFEKSRVPVGRVARVFVTHWHFDLFSGLGALINHSWINGRTEPLTVYGPPGVERVVKAIAGTYADDVRYRAENVGHDLPLSGGVGRSHRDGAGQGVRAGV